MRNRGRIPKLIKTECRLIKRKIPVLRLRTRMLLYIAAIVLAGLSMVQAIGGKLPYIIGISVHVLAAAALTAACYYLANDMKYGMKEKVKTKMAANPFANRVAGDYRYRTVVFAVPGLLINMIFAIFNGVIGAFSRSPWFLTLSVYYIFLSVMRFNAISYDRRVSKGAQTKALMQDEIRVYLNCGILFIAMTTALSGAVILLMHSKGGKNYPGVAIYAVAAYTFYKIIVSAVNLVKAGKTKSPLLMAIRDIGYIDACVSVLTLQTAMFSSFRKGQAEFETWMNGTTGAAVCLMVLAMGIRCICITAKMKRALREEGKE